MIGPFDRWLSTLVILVAVPGCDNVSWGGFDVRLQSPPAAEPAEVASEPEVVLPELPEGPVLFRLDRSGGRGTLMPVAEIAGDSLRPLPSETEEPGFRDYFAEQRMGPGEEFLLFAGGTRVGRFLAGDAGDTVPNVCSRPPAVEGVVELVPPAAGVTRFLALRSTEAGGWSHGDFAPLAVDQSIRAIAANAAGTVIMDEGARWPPSMAGARGDVQLVRMGPEEPPLIAATYLYQDRMAVEAAPAGSYSFFFLAEDLGGGHGVTYHWFREAGREGKGAARYVQHLDWDEDGAPEVLLEVLGATERWHAALSRTPPSWERIYEHPCGAADLQVVADP